MEVFGNDQWFRAGDMRISIWAPPTTAPWLSAGLLLADEVLHANTPAGALDVTVTNAGSGSIHWTVAEWPDVPWITAPWLACGNPGWTLGCAACRG